MLAATEMRWIPDWDTEQNRFSRAPQGQPPPTLRPQLKGVSDLGLRKCQRVAPGYCLCPMVGGHVTAATGWLGGDVSAVTSAPPGGKDLTCSSRETSSGLTLLIAYAYANTSFSPLSMCYTPIKKLKSQPIPSESAWRGGAAEGIGATSHHGRPGLKDRNQLKSKCHPALPSLARHSLAYPFLWPLPQHTALPLTPSIQQDFHSHLHPGVLISIVSQLGR